MSVSANSVRLFADDHLRCALRFCVYALQQVRLDEAERVEFGFSLQENPIVAVVLLRYLMNVAIQNGDGADL